MNLSTHFTLEEFTGSDTAARYSLDNDLPLSLMPAAKQTAQLLERIRDQLVLLARRDIPIIVTSGYRSPRLNQLVGGQPRSDHVDGCAADFKAPAFGTPFEICQALAPLVGELEIGQLIHEFGRWVHVSTRRPDKQLNRIITISQRGTDAGIVAV